MPLLQPIINAAELLYQKGIREVVISPGSRSAPLTLAIVRHGKFTIRVVADERAAGFIALGMAQQSRLEGSFRPVAIICTSGSAVYNLAPAVVEAFFQEIPLLLLTADRPHEWLGQQDGQTMHQTAVFGANVKRSYDLPADYTHPDAAWAINRLLNEAINLTTASPPGPVHVNVPLREPFYPRADELFVYESVRVIDVLPTENQLPASVWASLLDEWQQTDNKLIALGQLPHNPALLAVLGQISDELGIPIIGEITANLPRNDRFITRTDVFLGSADRDFREALWPDLLITCGLSFLGRNIKTFLRQHPAKRHWHIGSATDRIADPFQSLTTLIAAEPLVFLQKLFNDLDYQRFLQGDEDDETDPFPFLNRWQAADNQAGKIVAQTLKTDADSATGSEWLAVDAVLAALPTDSVLHLANSMPVRYANLCGLDINQRVAVSANRGVSGIDGCLSTAIGAALATTKIVTVLIGDVAFFYDRNGLLPRLLPTNLRVVLLNNHGGHIFRMIDGPGQQPELETYFETDQPLTAERTAADAAMQYMACSRVADVPGLLLDFFLPSNKAKLLELKTDKLVNQAGFRQFKQRVANERW
jgi:2-succinyl-5-enolpyruvyl-6-hydroxy-3-cyclohexene-1-carboxylate synthase